MLDQREFVVQLIVSSTHEYTIDARSESEAIAHAEGMYEDGEFGEVLNFDVENSDAFASDDVEDDEEDGEDYE